MLKVEPSQDSTAPSAPPAVRIDRASLSGVYLSWDPAPEEDVYSYRVYRTEGGETALLAEIPASEAAKYVDKAVVQGKTYSYGVTAVDTSLNESGPAASEEVKVEKGIVPVAFNVTVPDYTDGELFLAGSFGTSDYPTWDPAGITMQQVDATHWTVTLNLPEGANIEYKYTRNGTWDAVEKDEECKEIANRRLTVALAEGQTSLAVDDAVEKWRDLDACG
jgi:alpha-glucosidase